MARPQGHPILGVISGILFGLFLSVTLTVWAGVPFDSVLYIVLVAAGLVVGLALGWTGPFRRRRTRPGHARGTRATAATPEPSAP
ncbi:MAG TPA: hypothetical protein VKU86_02795 [Acidimicrobiales bacterium]|nr:hypothetical protein [Acidimicrobiales bacterium]